MNKKYDALVILGGGLKNDHGKWRTTNLDEGDFFGVTGGRLRVIAGQLLFNKRLSDLIVASGGRDQYKNLVDAPTVSEVIKTELMELGVPADRIIEDKKSGDTHQQLKFVKLLINSRQMKKIALVSSEWHLPRIKALIDYSPHLVELTDRIKLIAAEKVIIKYDKLNWQDEIAQARKSEELKKRIALEQRGARDIREGRYNFS